MTRKRQGLDELMIVNPDDGRGDALLLGDDGRLYRVEGLAHAQTCAEPQYFFGADGALYEVQSSTTGTSESAESHATQLGEEDTTQVGRFYLGSDGTLYEVVE